LRDRPCWEPLEDNVAVGWTDGHINGYKQAMHINGCIQAMHINGYKQAMHINGCIQAMHVNGYKQAMHINGCIQAMHVNGHKQAMHINGYIVQAMHKAHAVTCSHALMVPSRQHWGQC
jgi:hypothetical protein